MFFFDVFRDLPSRLHGFEAKFYSTAGRGTDILGPAEDLLNKNPSQSLSGKVLPNDPECVTVAVAVL